MPVSVSFIYSIRESGIYTGAHLTTIQNQTNFLTDQVSTLQQIVNTQIKPVIEQNSTLIEFNSLQISRQKEVIHGMEYSLDYLHQQFEQHRLANPNQGISYPNRLSQATDPRIPRHLVKTKNLSKVPRRR